MSDTLNATGRPILYSICNWGEDQPWVWGPSMANSWRISGDIWDSFDGDNGTCPWWATFSKLSTALPTTNHPLVLG